MNKIKIKKLHDKAILPHYATEGASAFDFFGERNGCAYDNYAKVKCIEDWMIDTQKQLKD